MRELHIFFFLSISLSLCLFFSLLSISFYHLSFDTLFEQFSWRTSFLWSSFALNCNVVVYTLLIDLNLAVKNQVTLYWIDPLFILYTIINCKYIHSLNNDFPCSNNVQEYTNTLDAFIALNCSLQFQCNYTLLILFPSKERKVNFCRTSTLISENQEIFLNSTQFFLDTIN